LSAYEDRETDREIEDDDEDEHDYEGGSRLVGGEGCVEDARVH
jgi:hypothetical protein